MEHGSEFCSELGRRRAAQGVSLAQLAADTHVNRSYLHRVQTGERWPSEQVARQLDEALEARGALLAAWRAENDERVDATANARRIEASLRDSQALDALLDDVPLGEAVTSAENIATTLAVKYLGSPPGPMLTAALDARAAVVSSFRRSPSSSQRVDLIRAAGYLSGVLAYATLDLGRPDAAFNHAATAWRCARSARDQELAAWVRGTQSLIARFEKEFTAAYALAQDGLTIAGPGTSIPRLLAGVAQSAANLGDRAEAHRALSAAADAADHADPDSFPGLFTFSRAKLSYYGGSALMWLPEREDSLRAAQNAESAIEQWAAGDPADRSLDDEALAHVYAATSYVRLGELDAAIAALGPVLALPDERRISWLRRRVGEIAHLLNVTSFRNSSEAAELAQATQSF